MAGEKECNVLDELTLPDILLSPFSDIKKQRFNKLLNFCIILALVELEILIFTLHNFFAFKLKERKNLHTESIRHSREIENFFKNLAAIDYASNLKIRLMNAQLEQLKSALAKLNDELRKIDAEIIALTKLLVKENMELQTAKNALEKSYSYITNYFNQCIDIDNLANFRKIDVDLAHLTNKNLGTFEIDANNYQSIMREANVALDKQAENRERINHYDAIKNSLIAHTLAAIRRSGTAATIDKHHPILHQAAMEIIKRSDDINKRKLAELIDDYNDKQIIVLDKELALTEKENAWNALLQQKSALIEGKELVSRMLDAKKADLSVLRQLNNSFDSLINDLVENSVASHSKLETRFFPHPCS